MLNRQQRFATEGFRVQRLNPDGTIPRASRFIGFAGSADLTAVLTTLAGSLTIKVDKTTQTKSVTFAANIVTVAQAVTALTTAAFTGITWSQDATTGRLKGVSATGTYIQVTGALAAALDFGQGIKMGGQGLVFAKYFSDEVASIGLPKNIKDKEEIDSEGAKGTVTRMVIGSKLQGMSPVLALKVKDYDLLEMIQGGTYNRTAGTYDPPTSDVSNHPTFYIEVFSPVYAAGVSKYENMTGYEKLLIRSCIGTEGDVPVDAKAWAAYSFNVESTECYDESSVKLAAWQESTLLVADWVTLDVLNV